MHLFNNNQLPRKNCAALAHVLIAGLFLMTAIPVSAAVWYVDDSAAGGGNGTSWATAYNDLQTALAAATSGDQIWAAAGTYKPAGPGGPPTATFQLKNGVAIYGGFASNETQLDQRNVTVNVTILSGDIDGNDNSNLFDDNTYHVVTGSGTDATAVLDGFTISDGNAPYSDGTPDQLGGGMYNEFGNPTLANCTFEDNTAYYGGGMYNYSGSPTLTNCTFSGNSADIVGGMYNDSGNPTLTNCTFIDNSTYGASGMYNASGNPALTNCTFSGNSADGAGAGMYNASGNPTLTNCTFSGNWANSSSGGGMFNSSGNPTLINCTFSGNQAGIGGGMYNDSGNPTLTNCTFSENWGDSGGGMTNYADGSGGSPSLTNCSFIGNAADEGGGISGGNLTLTNCTFSANGAYEGGGISGGNLILTNCTFSGNWASSTGGGIECFGVAKLTNVILWGNIAGYDPPSQIYGSVTATYSDIQGGYPGIGNIDADPLFVRNPIADYGGDYGDLRLRTGSPCIDAGNNSEVPVGVTTDLAGNPRFADDPNQTDCPTAPGTCGTAPIVDMGAYEGAVPTIVAWKSARLHGPNGPNGELSITLNPTASGNGTSGPTVETRNGGILKIVVTFDQPVSLVNSAAVTVIGQTTVGGVLQGPVEYSGSAITSMLDAQTMAILFEPAALPDETCYTFDIAGMVENSAGLALAGDTDCNIRSLVGDANGNGVVNTTDQSLIKSKISPPINVSTGPQYDLNVNGVMNTTDQSLVKSRVTSPAKLALCP